MFVTKCAGKHFNNHPPSQAQTSENLYAAQFTEVHMMMDKICGT